MQKEETLRLKGLAILMMLWLHLFSDASITESLHNLLWMGHHPLAYSLKKIMSTCVPIYIFLGGYGLAKTFERYGSDMGNHRRALSLMANLWVVCLFFVPLGCLVNPTVFPGSLTELLLNLLGISYSYNGAWWFLLPYALLTLVSAPLLRFLYQSSPRRNALVVALSLVLHITIYQAIDHVDIPHGSPLHVVYTLLNFLYMLFMFTTGATFAKYRWFERLEQRKQKLQASSNISLWLWAALAALCVLRLILGNSALLGQPFVLLFIPLCVLADKPTWLNASLSFFGKHSTNMWLTHYFFSHYIFGNLIYSLQHPVLIFVALVALSLASSYVVQLVYAPIRRRIRG